jgi:hypothetical protein
MKAWPVEVDFFFSQKKLFGSTWPRSPCRPLYLSWGMSIPAGLSDFPLANSCGNDTYVFEISSMCVSRFENCNKWRRMWKSFGRKVYCVMESWRCDLWKHCMTRSENRLWISEVEWNSCRMKAQTLIFGGSVDGLQTNRRMRLVPGMSDHNWPAGVPHENGNQGPLLSQLKTTDSVIEFDRVYNRPRSI